MADIPQKLLSDYGNPEKVTSKWVAWEHGCTEQRGYAPLLYSRDSGWMFCQVCGFKQGPRETGFEKGSDDGQVRVPKIINGVLPFRWSIPTHASHSYPYLRNRGLSDEEIQEHCFVIHHDDYEGRQKQGWSLFHVGFWIVEDGNVVSWHARNRAAQAARNHAVKWLSPKSDSGFLSTKETCWGLDRVVPGKGVWVFEGIFDAFWHPRGVAIMGTSPTEQQVIKILDRKPNHVIIAGDNDEVSRAVIEKNAEAFRRKDRHIPVGTCYPLDKKDYGEYVAEGQRFQCH